MTLSTLEPRPQLSNSADWIGFLRDAEIPVLAESAARLEELRIGEDAVDASTIGDAFAADPLMTLKILSYASTHRAPRLVTDTETVTATLVMMGNRPVLSSLRAASDGGGAPGSATCGSCWANGYDT